MSACKNPEKEKERRRKISESHKKENLSQESLINYSKGQIKRYEDPKNREKNRQGQIERFKDPEQRRIRSEGATKQFEDLEQRRKASKNQTKYFKDPKNREKDRQGQIERFKDPNEREKNSKSLKKHIQEDGFETHHYDENRNNNDPKNLWDYYRSMHLRVHRGRSYFRKKYDTELIFT